MKTCTPTTPPTHPSEPELEKDKEGSFSSDPHELLKSTHQREARFGGSSWGSETDELIESQAHCLSENDNTPRPKRASVPLAMIHKPSQY